MTTKITRANVAKTIRESNSLLLLWQWHYSVFVWKTYSVFISHQARHSFSPNVVIEVDKDSRKSVVFCRMNFFLENGKTPLKNILVPWPVTFFFWDRCKSCRELEVLSNIFTSLQDLRPFFGIYAVDERLEGTLLYCMPLFCSVSGYCRIELQLT